MKGRQIAYSEDELAFLRGHKTTPRAELTKLFNEKFSRSISCNNIKAKCQRMGLKTGRTGCFNAGHRPFNKGRKGWCAPGSEKGWFKSGNKPANLEPIGYERICNKDGYVLIKIDKPHPTTGHKGRFVLKHRHLWESVNGPVPAGHFLKSLDGNRQNCSPSNWVCLPSGIKPRLIDGPAGRDYDGAPKELKPSILATAKISQRIHEIRKQS